MRFICWPVEENEGDHDPVERVKRYEWERHNPFHEDDFEAAAELWAEEEYDRVGDGGQLVFVMNETTRETRVVNITVEYGRDYHTTEVDDEEATAWMVALALTAWHRWADEVRQRPWNWRHLAWVRDNPEEAARHEAELAARIHSAIDGKCPWPTGKAPASWSDVVWPHWVTEAAKADILRWDRRPQEWERGLEHSRNHAHFGEVVTLDDHDIGVFTGRYVPLINDSGLVVDDAGAVHRVNNRFYGRPIEELHQEIARRREVRNVTKLTGEITKAMKGVPSGRLAAALSVLRAPERKAKAPLVAVGETSSDDCRDEPKGPMGRIMMNGAQDVRD